MITFQKMQSLIFVFLGDVTVKNKIFGAFYVLLGAGIVAAFFGIFSNDVRILFSS